MADMRGASDNWYTLKTHICFNCRENGVAIRKRHLQIEKYHVGYSHLCKLRLDIPCIVYCYRCHIDTLEQLFQHANAADIVFNDEGCFPHEVDHANCFP